MCVYLRAKFEVSGIILLSFRQGVIPPPENKLLKNPPRLGLTCKEKSWWNIASEYQISKSPFF